MTLRTTQSHPVAVFTAEEGEHVAFSADHDKLAMPKEMLMFDMARNPGQSWGIRIGGGQDRGRALVLEKVRTNSGRICVRPGSWAA